MQVSPTTRVSVLGTDTRHVVADDLSGKRGGQVSVSHAGKFTQGACSVPNIEPPLADTFE